MSQSPSQSAEQIHDARQWQSLIESGNAAYETRKYTEAELKFAAALRIAEKWSTPESLPESDSQKQQAVLERLAKSLNNMAALYHTQGKYKMAQDLYERCLEIKVRLYSEEHPEVAINLHNLAVVHSAKGRWEVAEPLYQRSLALKEKALGRQHSDLTPILTNYALMLRRTKRDQEAQEIESRLQALSVASSPMPTTE
jgi:tetratricopeptide (TPR) repeat protein